VNEAVREYADTQIHDRTEDYYLGKREWEYPKMSLSGLRDFCEGRKT